MIEKCSFLDNIIIIFGMVWLFMSRILVSLGISSLFNFFHYFYFLFWYVLYLISDIISDRKHKIHFFILFLLVFFFLSTIINGVSVINFFISFLLLSQPFILLYLFYYHVDKCLLSKVFLCVILLNTVMAFVQYLILGYRVDNVRGLFLDMGAGAHICGIFAICAMLYFFIYRKGVIRFIGVITQLLVLVFCDNKQSLFVLLISLLIFGVFHIKKFIQKIYVILLFLICCLGVYILSQTIFTALQSYLDFKKVFTGILLKLKVFLYMAKEGTVLNYLVGFGAGMTVSRTAQILPDYSILINFGATISPLHEKLFSIMQSHWLTNSVTGSSMFSFYFSYAGIIGDFGLIGFIVLLLGYFLILGRKCESKFTKLIFIFFFLHGFIFQWIEEPQFVGLFIILICCFSKDKINNANCECLYE